MSGFTTLRRSVLAAGAIGLAAAVTACGGSGGAAAGGGGFGKEGYMPLPHTTTGRFVTPGRREWFRQEGLHAAPEHDDGAFRHAGRPEVQDGDGEGPAGVGSDRAERRERSVQAGSAGRDGDLRRRRRDRARGGRSLYRGRRA